MVPQSAVYRLPTEILLSIFGFSANTGSDSLCASVPDLNETYRHMYTLPSCPWPDVFDVQAGPWVIGRVCRVWRSTALSSPSLWCCFHVGEPSCSEEAAMQLLGTWISRSGERLLNFRVVTNALCLCKDGVKLLRILISVSKRWHIVEIVNSSAVFWDELQTHDVGHNLLSLKELAILCRDDDPTYSGDSSPELVYKKILSNTPKLDSLINLDFVNLAHIDVPWAQLTTYVSTNFCLTTDQLTVLRRARNLVRCSMTVTVQANVLDEVEAEGAPIVLDRLRYWKSCWYSSDSSLGQSRAARLTHVVTPALEELSVMCELHPQLYPPFCIFASILRSSSCPLKSLELSGSAANEDDVLALIEAATTITQLRVWLNSPIQRIIIACLDAKRDVPLAPLLEHLELGLDETADIRELDMTGLAVATRSRLSSEIHPVNGVAPLQSLTFVIEGSSDVDGGFPPIIDVLQEEGLNVYVRNVKPGL